MYKELKIVDYSGLKDKHILLIEDDHLTYLFLKQVFKIAGVQLTHASTGTKAIDEVKKKVFDAIITDIQLPDINGFELIIQLRNVTSAPVITQTASRNPELEEEALKAGSTAFLFKPYKQDKLFELLEEII